MNLNKSISYSKKLVKKPWGNEYLIFENGIVAIWMLNIKSNKNTSLHCHTKKKTGLILLEGSVEVDLGFYETKKLFAPDKVMLRPGLFHSSKSLNIDSKLLEIEIPIDKEDLVRFEDNYGRQEKPYEGTQFFSPLQKNEILLKNPGDFKQEYIFKNSILSFERHYNCNELINKDKDTIFAIIKGGLYSSNSQTVLSPGDVVRTETIKKLSEVFKIKNYIDVLVVNKNGK